MTVQSWCELCEEEMSESRRYMSESRLGELGVVSQELLKLYVIQQK